MNRSLLAGLAFAILYLPSGVSAQGCCGMDALSPTVAMALVCLLSGAALPQQAVRMDIHTYRDSLHALTVAARQNPRLAAADARVQASSASVKIQKSLEPPQFGFEFMQAPITSFPNPFKDQMEYDYSIQQMLPFPGKLGAMSKAEQRRTEMLRADRLTEEQTIVRTVGSLYAELYLKDRQLEINRETQTLAHEVVAVARKQYELGMAGQPDVLRAQSELAKLGSDTIVLIQQRRSMVGMLNALCNRAVATEIGLVPEIDPVSQEYDLNALLALAEVNRPELKSMQSGIDMQRAELAAARKEYLPDFMVRGTYKQPMHTRDAWSLMVGATIPVVPWSLRKTSAETVRSNANAQTAQGERDNMKNMIASEVNDALLKVQSSEQRLRLSRETLIPQAQETLESTLAAYQTGKREFLMLLDTQRMLVMAKLDYHMAAMSLLDAQSQLERAVGLSIDEIDKSTRKGQR